MARACAVLGVMLLATGLTGCAALGSVLAPGGLRPPLPSIVGAPTSGPLQHYSDGSTSERGNIPKLVGQKAGILSPDGRSHVVTFTVTRIVTDPHCLNQAASAPANGHYVEVDLDVVTTAGMGIEGSDPTVTFGPDNWYFYPPDGDGLIAGGVGAFAAGDDCELSVPALPDAIGASQTVSGSVLLDVRPGSVYLSYNPQLVCGCDDGWEWPYAG